MDEKTTLQRHERERERLQELSEIVLPLASASELTEEDKKAAVRGALSVKLGLMDDIEEDIKAMQDAGKISSIAGDELYRRFGAYTGRMLDYVHQLVGFEGDHGKDINL